MQWCIPENTVVLRLKEIVAVISAYEAPQAAKAEQPKSVPKKKVL
jgi:hypothetical protein